MRGGMFQLENFDNKSLEQYEKLISINLCSNLVGQVAISLVCNPPNTNEEYNLFIREKDNLLNSLKNKSLKIYDSLNRCKNIFPQKPQGAM